MTRPAGSSLEATAERIKQLARDASIEILPRQLNPEKIGETVSKIKAGRSIFIPSLPNQNPLETTVAGAVRLKELGYDPVPHIAVRNYRDQTHLAEAMRILNEARITGILLIAGDNPRPGAIKDTLQVLEDAEAKGLLSRFNHIGFAGHPEGNPNAPPWKTQLALQVKNTFARETGIEAFLVSQLCFNPETLLGWVRRTGDNRLPVIAGIFGPLKSPARLLRIARQTGFRWQRILANAFAMAGAYLSGMVPNVCPVPDRLLLAYAQSPDVPAGIHVYTFGNISRTEEMLMALEQGRFKITRNAFGQLRLRIEGFARPR